MKAQISKSSDVAEVDTPERCFIQAVWSTPEDEDVSIARARVNPGVTTVLHEVTVDERYLIIQGNGVMEMGRSSGQEVGPGDVVVIPKGTPQRITNTGEHDLVFYCICSPRFTPEVYRDLEKPS